MNGIFQEFNLNGEIIMMGNYKDDKLDGKVRIFYKFPSVKAEKIANDLALSCQLGVPS